MTTSRSQVGQREGDITSQYEYSETKVQYRPAQEMIRIENEIEIPVADEIILKGDLRVPAGASGIVLFVHGSGSSRFSPRNRYVAEALTQAGLGTLLFDLFTPMEEAIDLKTPHLRYNLKLLSQRLIGVAEWVITDPLTHHLKVGYFGASTGAGAALVAAAERPELVQAIVSRGGRPDLADWALLQVKAPTLLIVGSKDSTVLELNWGAFANLHTEKELAIVPEATHLFEEPGALEQVVELSQAWFKRYLIK